MPSSAPDTVGLAVVLAFCCEKDPAYVPVAPHPATRVAEVGTPTSKLFCGKRGTVGAEVIPTLPPLHMLALVGDITGVSGAAFTVCITVVTQPAVVV